MSSEQARKFIQQVALLAEGVDRNVEVLVLDDLLAVSPSSRRAWIEMYLRVLCRSRYYGSPSSRRAWIEMMRPCRVLE